MLKLSIHKIQICETSARGLLRLPPSLNIHIEKKQMANSIVPFYLYPYRCSNKMKNPRILSNGIPISISLNPTVENENIHLLGTRNKKRIFTISALSILVAIVVSFIAKVLVGLINLITNIAFHGAISVAYSSPAHHSLGWFVIIIPVIGGVIVGLMALYGSKAIRGHGIPEAMEQILTNQSKIKPSITFLKPLSAAISIGTGGPFGAEGPIIATGGALGSTIGQFLRISSNERKICFSISDNS